MDYRKAENKTDKFLVKVVRSRWTAAIVGAVIAGLVVFSFMGGALLS